MSLQDPNKKMSKSDDNLNNIITLLDTDNIIKKKISRAVTDSGSEIKYIKEKPGLSNLIDIFSSFTNLNHNEIEENYKGKMYSDLKRDLAEVIIETICPIRAEYNKIINDKDYINNILKKGSEQASYKARKTLSKVYRKIGFIKK